MPSTSPQITNGLGTLHDPTDEEKDKLREFARNHCKYLVLCEEECPTTGRPHLHFVFVTSQQKRLCWLHKHVVGRHISDLKFPLKSTNPEDKKFAPHYCKKGTQTKAEWDIDGNTGLHFGDNAVFEEFGDITAIPHQGKRTDLEQLREVALAADSWRDVIRNPDIAQPLSRNMQYAKEVFYNKPPQARTWVSITGNMARSETDFYPWQQNVLDICNSEADGRTINWVYDFKGQNGKSKLVTYILCNMDAISLAGKAENMFHAYDMQKIILVDIPRATKDEYINYGAIEKLKDGVFFSGKYGSTMKIRNKNAHVFVFSNHKPDPTAWTSDRLNLITLSDEDPQPAFDDQFGTVTFF